jgi:PAS domain S-box-containing protein
MNRFEHVRKTDNAQPKSTGVPLVYQLAFGIALIGGILFIVGVAAFYRLVVEISWQRIIVHGAVVTAAMTVGLGATYIMVSRAVIRSLEAEERLAGEKHFVDAVLESLDDLFFVTDLDGRLVKWNRAAREASGCTDEELGRASPKDFFPPEQAEWYIGAMSEVFRKGRATAEIILRSKTGEEAPFESTLTLLRDREGRPLYVCGVSRDITERKRAEEELQRINNELEGFAHTVSHDLKGPLTAMEIAFYALQEVLGDEGSGAGSEEVRELVGIIENKIEHSNTLIDDLLALAEAGQVPSETSLVEVREVVDRVLEEQEQVAAARGASIVVDDDMGRLRASEVHIYQLFSNLIGDAIAHNDSDNPMVEVGYAGRTKGAHCYSVCDNGPGIPEDLREKVFRPFFTTRGGGTGVGLTTVARIVELYGGEISISGEGGARFEFSIRELGTNGID